MTGTKTTYTVEESNAFMETFTIEPTASGPLDGLTFAVKDLIDVAGHVTSWGSPSWRDAHTKASVNAVCVEQILAAGATCVGKTATDEFTFGLTGENHFFGTPLNPKAPDRAPGGSSSGSASAVACGLVDFAIGSDTGGSVRVPASNCGVYGWRPTHGLISVAGVNVFAPTYDTIGILARDAEVLSKTAEVLISCDIPTVPDEIGTIHLIKEAFELADENVRQAMAAPVNMIKELFSGKTRETSLREIDGDYGAVGLQRWYECYYPVQWGEIWSCLGSWITDNKPELGPRTKMNFELTKGMDRKTINAAARQRETLFRRVSGVLGPFDLLCFPTSPVLAPIKNSLSLDRTKGDYYPRTLAMTSISGITRTPQVTMPLAEVDGTPIGLSLLAKCHMDAFLLAMARAISAKSGGK